MAYFIDTNIWVAALRGRAPQVKDRMLRLPPSEIFVPHQVLAELRVGAAKSARPEHHDRQVGLILSPFSIVWPDESALEHYVAIRLELESAGQRISEPDLWIAAIARAAAGTLVTHNTEEFERVSDLKMEDWLLD
jgi:tRNA(fMet)-specific endonuclease VapC